MSPTRLLIYMPTYGRPSLAYEQALNINSQIRANQTSVEIEFVISINSDKNYSKLDFAPLSDKLIMQHVNLGAPLNITLGYTYAVQNNFDYVWIIGDDEPIPKKAVEIVCTEISQWKIDILIGSLKFLGELKFRKSYFDLSNKTKGTISFVSSLIFKTNMFSLADIELVKDFHFSHFPHLVILNLILNREKNLDIKCISLLSICRVDKRHNWVGGQTPRNEFGYYDSVVFFGKALAIFAVEDKRYRRKELFLWWLMNWHRVKMFQHHSDFRSRMLENLSYSFKIILPLIWISKIPMWKIKDFISPVKEK